MAKAACTLSNGGARWTALMAAAKAPPMVAPMNSEGEKMPPDEPEPRLSEVAASLARKKQRQEAAEVHVAGEDRLHGGVADAVDEVLPESGEEAVHQQAHQQHAEDMAQVTLADAVEGVFDQVQAAHEARGGGAGDAAQDGVEHSQHH